MCSDLGVITCTIGQVISIGKKGLIKKCSACLITLREVCKGSQEVFMLPTYTIHAPQGRLMSSMTVSKSTWCLNPTSSLAQESMAISSLLYYMLSDLFKTNLFRQPTDCGQGPSYLSSRHQDLTCRCPMYSFGLFLNQKSIFFHKWLRIYVYNNLYYNMLEPNFAKTTGEKLKHEITAEFRGISPIWTCHFVHVT